MRSIALNAYMEKRLLDSLQDKELLPLMTTCKRWSDLIIAILHKRRGHFVPLELPPDWNNASLTSVIEDVFSPNPLHVYKIEPITGGFSLWSKVYKLTINRQQYVVRHVDHPTRYDLGKELALTSYFSDKKIAPKMHYCSIDKKVVIIEFVANTTPMLMVAMTPPLLREIADFLRVVHEAQKFPLSDKVEKLVRASDEKIHVQGLIGTFKLFNSYGALLAEMEKIEQFIDASHCCHNDLNPNNILFDGMRLHVIDWELAGNNDPFLDLATIVALLRLSPEQETIFLFSYFKRELTATESAKLYLFKQLILMQKAISFFAKILAPENVLSLNTAAFPPMSQWSPVDIPLDLSTDEGKYILSIMLLKECVNNISTVQYVSAFATLETTKEPSLKIEP